MIWSAAITDQAIGWAVFLGANTVGRLALEWRIPKARASRLLERAAKSLAIIRIGHGHYARLDEITTAERAEE